MENIPINTDLAKVEPKTSARSLNFHKLPTSTRSGLRSIQSARETSKNSKRIGKGVSDQAFNRVEGGDGTVASGLRLR